MDRRGSCFSLIELEAGPGLGLTGGGVFFSCGTGDGCKTAKTFEAVFSCIPELCPDTAVPKIILGQQSTPGARSV